MNVAQGVYEGIGLAPEEAFLAFWPLVKGTIKNIEEKGTVASLTGPIARGDVKTVERHLRAFREKRPELLGFYIKMAEMTVGVGLRKGSLKPAPADEIMKSLKEVKDP
jgi:predicted short-subunit dehydrogenase-like oxidoreductase (DUF2520 family)